ncbi:MAG: N-acetylmuramoyl-L-alanine amidase, partial [Ktedonobacterales bacterium]|nr:N-acetylmuramoyl-L-alanine amidase [Ktedonobacterales bacterium]
VLTDPATCCGSNYLVDGADPGVYPTVTQLIPERDVAYHAGNLAYNQYSIGIEHVGFTNTPDGFYTQAMYEASARLVAYLSLKYRIPLDRAHILGHSNVPGPTTDTVSHQHWDPGSYWDWPYYMALVRADAAQLATGAAALPAPSVPARYQATRQAIRTVTVNATHAAASDVPTWEQRAYLEYTPIYADDNGKPSTLLVRGASDPTTAVDEQHYDTRDFSCDTIPEHPVGTFSDPLNTNFDLRAKADDGEAFALLGTSTAPDGTRWDKINFNGTAGWMRDAQTSDGWGLIVTFGTNTAIYGNLDGFPICADSANGFSRVGQSYVAQEVETGNGGATWYAIYYNHHVAWLPASEVTVR